MIRCYQVKWAQWKYGGFNSPLGHVKCFVSKLLLKSYPIQPLFHTLLIYDSFSHSHFVIVYNIFKKIDQTLKLNIKLLPVSFNVNVKMY